MYHNDLAKYFRVEKHYQFSTDFFAGAEDYEAWDEIDFDNLEEVDGENTYEIKTEDAKFYAEACQDDNPLMVDEEYAEKSPYGGLVVHPIFVSTICFWCVGAKGRGNWIRTPGARNPGQVLEIHEYFRIGETIHVKMKPYDRYIKRGKCYLTYMMKAFNQDENLKCTMYATLILPRTREDIRKFLKGVRGLED